MPRPEPPPMPPELIRATNHVARLICPPGMSLLGVAAVAYLAGWDAARIAADGSGGPGAGTEPHEAAETISGG